MAASLTILLLAMMIPIVILTASGSTRPNIILFVIDDLGWNDTGYQGAGYTTPTIDRLTEEGIRLKQYYVTGGCSPSRSSLLAGKYAYTLGLSHASIGVGIPYGLNLSEVTIAQHLKKGGYATHAVGKWNLGMHKWRYTPTYRGFDTFYGYYGGIGDYFIHNCSQLYADNNTKESVIANGIDLRNNTDPVTNENGTYSTNLFTRSIQNTIMNHNATQGPFFIYAAYQSVHDPLQVPNEYLTSCASIPYENRKIFCGMMMALDEGIDNITTTLDDEGYLNNTVVIFTTDNGGQTDQGSSNWPLRGNKATLFEGGIRGFSFVWAKNLNKSNYDNTGLMHITDWYRTIIEGIAGIELSDNEKQGLEGYNMWSTVAMNSSSPRSEILLALYPPSYIEGTYYIGQAAIREGDWKLITGQPDCNVPFAPTYPGFSGWCPTGWVHPNGTVEDPPPNPFNTWLFNVTNDPQERNDVAEEYPDVVEHLKAKIEVYNSSHVVQISAPFDPRADPKYFDGVWTPWLE